MVTFLADENTHDHNSSESEPLYKPVFLNPKKMLEIQISPDCKDARIVPTDDIDEEMKKWWESDEAAFWMGM